MVGEWEKLIDMNGSAVNTERVTTLKLPEEVNAATQHPLPTRAS